MHRGFDERLQSFVDLSSQVGPELLAEVLARVRLKAPQETSRVEIAGGLELPGARREHQVAIPQGTVSKAVKVLMGAGLVEDGVKLMRNEAGRTLAPLRLGRGLCIAGAHIGVNEHGLETLTTALTGLDGTVLRSRSTGLTASGADPWEGAARALRGEVLDLLRRQNQQQVRQGSGPLELFGLGVCVPAYVQDGCVVSQPASGWDKTAPLARTLSELFGWAVPVVVENDVNALAVLATYSMHLPEPDIAVVAVFDGGLGGGLVMDGRLRRGGAGMAMEVGHLSVGCAPGGPADGMGPSPAGFDPTCTCGALGHLNAFAVPRRIRAVLGVDSNAEAAALPAGEPGARTRYYDVFREAGGALGRGLVQTVNLVNPTRILLFVPGEFVTPGPASAASAYMAGVTDELRHAYSTGAEVANLTVRPLGPVEEMGLFCAKAAAVCLFNGFFDHAKGFDNCQLPQRRPSRESEASQV